MQTLWSRVAQTRGTCCCPQCLQTTHGVGRRATASATRRSPKFIISSTLWYSGIFAAAATFDVGAKKRRREQWDQAIAGVKQELGQPTEAEGQRLEGNQRAAQIADTTEKSRLHTVAGAGDVFSEVEPQRRKPQWPTNTGPALKIHRLPPESIYATEERGRRSELRRWTPKKLETVMLSVDALQLKIFLALQKDQNAESRAQASAAVPIQYRDQMFLSEEELNAAINGKVTDMRRLWNVDHRLSEWSRSDADVALSDYGQDDQGLFHDTACTLNQCLQDLFRQHTSQTLSTPSLLAKVAYNLSVTSAPPNVHTYNTLLLGLSRAEQPALLYSVIRSLRETHVRPNEVTNAAILNHYTAVDDARQFVRWIEVMRGKHGGLALARSDIYINEAGASRLLREKRNGDEHEKVLQLPYPTPTVFRAVIKGVLKFSGFDTALSICEGMHHEGWGLCMNGLTPLLMDCADRKDWTSGLAVWRQIQALKATSARGRVHRGDEVEHIGLGTYAAMLRLCSASGRKEPFQNVWRQALHTHRDKKDALSKMVWAQDRRASKPGVGRSGSLESSEVQPQPGQAVEDAPAAHLIADEPDGAAGGSVGDDWLEPSLSYASHQRLSSAPAGQVLRELQGSKTTNKERKGQDHAASRGLSCSDGATGEPSHTSAMLPPSKAITTPNQPPILLREQVDDWLPPSHELDDYESRERPMAIYG